MMTVAQEVEATLYGDCRNREGNFLVVATDVLKVSQQEIDERLAKEKADTGVEHGA
jgi:hypothetical protein